MNERDKNCRLHLTMDLRGEAKAQLYTQLAPRATRTEHRMGYHFPEGRNRPSELGNKETTHWNLKLMPEDQGYIE